MAGNVKIRKISLKCLNFDHLFETCEFALIDFHILNRYLELIFYSLNGIQMMYVITQISNINLCKFHFNWLLNFKYKCNDCYLYEWSRLTFPTFSGLIGYWNQKSDRKLIVKVEQRKDGLLESLVLWRVPFSVVLLLLGDICPCKINMELIECQLTLLTAVNEEGRSRRGFSYLYQRNSSFFWTLMKGATSILGLILDTGI